MRLLKIKFPLLLFSFSLLVISQPTLSQIYIEPINDIKLTDQEKQTQREMKAIESCHSYDEFRYCLYPGAGKNSNKLIYFFHGILGMENIWIHNQTYLKIQTEWRNNPQGRPTVVNITYGRVYLLTPLNERKLSGILDKWTKDFITQFETSELKIQPAHRYVLGSSMGGHNALNLYIKMFPFISKLGLLCPAQLLNSPYASKEEVQNVLPEVDSIWPMYIGAMGLMSLYYDETSWAQASPFNYPQNKLQQLKNIRMILVNEDLYGFTEVNRRWVQYLNSLGGNADYRLSSGLHCGPRETKFLSDFLN